MQLIWEGIQEAIALLLRGDPQVLGVAALTLQLSLLSTLLALLFGVPLGAVVALTRFPGRGLLVSLVNTGMGLPPVVVGLFVSIMLWRSGPLGFLQLLYTPRAIIIAQFVIAFPVIAGLTSAALQQLDPEFRMQLLSIGASRTQLLAVLLWEARLPMLAAVMAGFGAVCSPTTGSSVLVPRWKRQRCCHCPSSGRRVCSCSPWRREPSEIWSRVRRNRPTTTV